MTTARAITPPAAVRLAVALVELFTCEKVGVFLLVDR